MAVAKEITGVLSSFSYGYKVKVLINSVDIGIKGGKSESKRLFAQDSALLAKATSEMKKLFCLKKGTNTIEVEFEKLSKNAPHDKVEVSVEIAGRSAPLFFLQSTTESGRVEKKITIKGGRL